MRSYVVKENHINSAVSKILLYRQTDRQTDRHDPVTNYKCTEEVIRFIKIYKIINVFLLNVLH